MSNLPLIRVSCVVKKEHIGLVNYSDMIVHDEDHNIVAIRIGGYPESVQAMSDAILGGCDLELEGSTKKINVNSKGRHNYVRRISHDGIYAEAMHYLKDDSPQSLMIGDDDKSDKESVNLNKNLYFFCKNSNELYAELDRKLSVPLIPEFKEYFISELQKRNILEHLNVYSLYKPFEGWHMNISSDESELVEILEDGLKNGQISIPYASKTDENIFHNIRSFTQYLQKFGTKIAGRIKECFPPLFNPAEEPISPEIKEVNNYVIEHAGYSLFDAQLGAAEALKKQLEKDKLALLVAECGTGKTKIGSTALYAYQHSNPNRSVYNKAFNVVICPSHITDKWVRELHETIPNCYAQHVSTMADVDHLYEIYQKGDKIVYCILSKETSRNGYMRRPAVKWDKQRKGFYCPHCWNIQEMDLFLDGSRYTVNADASFFLNENSKNHKCQFCGEPLWTMLNPNDVLPKRNEWVRIGSYGFIHRKFAYKALEHCKSKEQIAKIDEVVNNPHGVFIAPGAYARYPLSSYIKKRIRHIDAVIVDELHQYSGESAQGQSMAELAGIADKVIGMTATLVNGYAKGIFYLLFRLKAHLMLLDKQEYRKSREFCMQYGVVEEMFELDTSNYNTSSKSTKRKVREKFLPGISPIVYSRFLLENTVFLSLADMGKELPDYEEIPVFCRMNEPVEKEYKRLEEEFKRITRTDKKIGNRILSSYLNLLSAYPDQPYGHDPLYNPFKKDNKEELIVPKDTGKPTDLQPKDSKVIELIEQKIATGERVIIYTAWTRLDTQTKLHKLLTERQISTAILDTKVPTTKREQWVDKKLREGVKVLIVNPALVETGLDLNAFTTLIFFNIAFNLYIFRQASRRSWRINQTAPKVEVYMFYYKDTMQQRALRLMASKLSAATVIEGNISDEGLAAMSDCEDLTTQLAKELMMGLKENTEDLADSFRKMAILGNRTEREKQSQSNVVALPMQAAPDSKPMPVTTALKINTKIIQPVGKKYDTGQLSIFDLLAS